jgi:subtilisin family serine protease
MVGSAPGAKLYAMKVFPASGDPAPSSVVLEALDRVLTLKRNFNNGVPVEPVAGDGSEENPFVYDSLNIQVVNLSLGGPTLFPGHELEDVLVLEMLKEGITVVSAVGNEGFAAFTGGSPGTSVGSLTVGATSTAQHERVLRDLQFDLGIGALFRPNENLQTAYFSSRGPTADGRQGLQLVSNGFASFVQGADGSIAFVSGTSFSAPTMAGAAALLWQAHPDSEAAAIRDALSRSADTAILPNSMESKIDRGNGFSAIDAANTALVTGNVSNRIAELPELQRRPSEVEDNIEHLGLEVLEIEEDEAFTSDIELTPGDIAHYFIETSIETDTIAVQLSSVTAELPPEQQNLLFGDAFLVTLVDAPTSINEVLVDERILGDTQFTVNSPQSGIIRLAILGD